ncbi:FecR family protein [Croceivirga sp. JEA036]|uniref:FecR family protein n=1 Tax=Croceivirga sp. JEA036 TaxID=2721162 RepID=UPI00143B45C8|nr:FecR domain-containing protein [Croceivirga sp. JEA036]NJB35549.1 FecR family protein [Croceivirga sp. JEA036]
MIQRRDITVDNLLEDTSFTNWAEGKNQNDIDFWNQYIKQHPDQIATIRLAKDCVLGIHFKSKVVPEKQLNNAWEKLNLNLENPSERKPISSKSKWGIITGIAASIALVAVLFFKFQNDIPNEYKTGVGETLKVTLTDGTKVHLNSNSSIQFPKNNPRNITLNGEAYFDVEKKPTTKAKFFVTTNDLTIEVYGTRFNVNTRRNKTDVSLDEGNIHLKLKNGVTKKMIPGDYISYSDTDDQVLKHKRIEEIAKVSAWKSGSLEFNETPLYIVATQIEDIYNITIEFKDGEAPNQLMSGGIPVTNLDICLNAIAKATNTLIHKEENDITIQMKKH